MEVVKVTTGTQFISNNEQNSHTGHQVAFAYEKAYTYYDGCNHITHNPWVHSRIYLDVDTVVDDNHIARK